VLVGLSVFPLAIIFYLLYAHVVSFLDPILTIVLGGGFALALLILLFRLIMGIVYFVKTMFKDDKELDKRGFKKNL
jgi:Na+-transporting methylmalonyl-CoA/oxaloacetate decarboxylase gamma subunit